MFPRRRIINFFFFLNQNTQYRSFWLIYFFFQVMDNRTASHKLKDFTINTFQLCYGLLPWLFCSLVSAFYIVGVSNVRFSSSVNLLYCNVSKELKNK